MPQGKLRVAAEALQSIDSGNLAGSYVDFGSAFSHEIRIVKITNNSTVDVTVSYDGGTNDNEYVPAGSFVLLDLCANREPDLELIFPVGTQVSIKGSEGSGSIYMSAYHAR